MDFHKIRDKVLRGVVIALAALLVYFQGPEILQESTQDTATESNAEGENTAGENTAGENTAGENIAGEQTAGEHTAGENTAGENTFAGNAQEDGNGILTREEFCRTTYEVFVYSFCDSNGDGIGDLPGLFSRLDYINDGEPGTGEDLGMTGLWLMPVFPSATYHKYDVNDFMNIDPSYGTLEDLDALLAACHERGMTVILDLPVNHTSTSHPWFQKAAKYLRELPPGRDAVKEECPYVWYYQFAREQYDGYVPLPDSEWYYEARFWSEMPDLNLTTGEVREELKAVTDFWLDRGVDGFRLDAVTSYYTDNRQAGIDFTGWLTKTVKDKNPFAYMVGEAWTDQNSYAEFYKSGIDSLFDFAFAGRDGMISRVVNGQESVSSFVRAMEWEEELYTSMNPAAVNAPFYSNHDMDRGADYYGGGDSRRVKIAEGLNLLMTGNAFLYYGEELGMKGSGKDEDRRAPMYWSENPQSAGMCAGPPGMSAIRMEYGSLEKQKDDPKSNFRYVREAVRIRENFPVIARGKTVRIPDLEEERFCGFYRTSEKWDDVLILINTGDTAVTRRLPQEAAEYRNLCAALYTGEESAALNSGEITVPPGAIVFLQKEGR